MNDPIPDVAGVAVSRRGVLQMATVAAGVAIGASASGAQTGPAPGYGAPLVEVCVPSGVLTLEQKSAMIEGITNVLRRVIAPSPNQSGPLFVEIIETGEGGFGVNGKVFVPKAR